MDTNSFAFALAMCFVYWFCQYMGVLIDHAFEAVESRRLVNKILKKSLEGG